MEQIVSIIAPAYNHERFIKDSIYSIINQTYKDIQLIIIDDCSKDSTCKEIENIIINKDIERRFIHGIHFIKHESNRGAHNSINEGLKLASGHYLTIINTDDLYQPNRIEVMVEALKKNKSNIAFSRVDTIDDCNNIGRNFDWKYYSLQDKIFQRPRVNFALITDNVAISTGNLFFTKALYNKVGEFNNYKYIHDWDYILRCTLVDEPIFVKDTSYLYRIHDTNTFKELDKDLELCGREYYEVMTRYLKNIKNGNFENDKIASIDVLDYFIKYIICDRGLEHLWNIQ